MNIDRAPKIAKRLQTPEHLVDEAWHFANTLAAGRWSHERIKEVETIQKIIESVGDDYELDEHYGEAIFDEVIVTFSALKQYVETKRGYVLAPTYSITSSTSQFITKDEIPENVFNQIIHDADDEDHPLNVAIEESGMQTSDLHLDTLEDFDVERTQEVTYLIGHDGEIEEYMLRYFYCIDDINVHEVMYSYSVCDAMWAPISLADGSVLEKKPIVLAALNEAEVDTASKDIDASFDRFLIDEDFQTLTEFSAQPRQEHIRRALGMISLASSGYIDLRKRPVA